MAHDKIDEKRGNQKKKGKKLTHSVSSETRGKI